MEILPPPRKSITEVLYRLITRPEIKERDFSINSFRDIIHELKTFYEIPIRHKDKRGVTKYGKTVVYRVHYLWNNSVTKARRIYLEING